MSDEVQNQVMEVEALSPNDSAPEYVAGQCRSCGNPQIEEGYAMELCSECRKKLSRRPIPVAIKMAAGVVAAIVLYTSMSFPHSLGAGIEFERGLKDEKAKKYVSAMRHFENTAKVYPKSDKVMVKLMNAYYQNNRVEEAYKTLDTMIGTSAEGRSVDKALADEVNGITAKIDLYYSPSKDLYAKLKTLKDPTKEELMKVIVPYVQKNPTEIYGVAVLSNVLYDQGQYAEVEKLMSKVVEEHPDYYAGILLKASALREEGRYADAQKCVQLVLDQNAESTDALGAMSRIELKQKENTKGLEYALKAYNINKSDPYILATLSMAYHFNGKVQERDQTYKAFLASGKTDAYSKNLLADIFSGKLNWQKN